jgi:hypothetical protein
MKWTDEETELAKKLLESGMSYKQIGEKINRTDMSIRMRLLKKYNIKRTDFHSFYITKKCLNCNNEFSVTNGNDRKYDHKFCGHSCSATYTNKKRVQKRKDKKKCLNCNSELHKGSKYCSNTCKAEHNRINQVKQWLANEITGTINGGSFELLQSIRNYVMSSAADKCEECGDNRKNPYSGRSILTIDHIDGDASNNRPENLKVLCPTCHALTSTYGNIGNRTSARKAYRKKYR